MKDRSVLVTGASGFIGSHLVDELIARGYRVRALVRPTSGRRFLDPRTEFVYGDVSDPLSLTRAVAGVCVVYHLAGVISTFRPVEYRQVNEVGARNLVRACAKVVPDLGRFVLVSSLAASGPSRDGRPVRETDAPRPVSEYGRSKLAGERAVMAAAGRIPVTILRPPMVYGPRDRGVLEFFRLALAGWRPVFPAEKYYSLCHARDLVRGIVDAGESDVARGGIYHLAEGRAWSSRAFLSEIAAAVGGRPRGLPVPEPLLRLVGPVADWVQREFGFRRRPLGDKIREVLPRFWIADVGRARRDLGFTTRIPLSEGLRETAAFYRDAGWIARCS